MCFYTNTYACVHMYVCASILCVCICICKHQGVPLTAWGNLTGLDKPLLHQWGKCQSFLPLASLSVPDHQRCLLQAAVEASSGFPPATHSPRACALGQCKDAGHICRHGFLPQEQTPRLPISWSASSPPSSQEIFYLNPSVEGNIYFAGSQNAF